MQAAIPGQCDCAVSLVFAQNPSRSPLENNGVSLGFSFHDIEDPDGLVRRASRQTFAIEVELSIMLKIR
jgi:hypothetical protein